MEMLKWAQTICLHREKVWALIYWNKGLAVETLEDHLCDWGGKARCFCNSKEVLAWAVQSNKQIKIACLFIQGQFRITVKGTCNNRKPGGAWAVEMAEIILGQKEAARLKKVPLLSDIIKWVQKTHLGNWWRDPGAASLYVRRSEMSVA